MRAPSPIGAQKRGGLEKSPLRKEKGKGKRNKKRRTRPFASFNRCKDLILLFCCSFVAWEGERKERKRRWRGEAGCSSFLDFYVLFSVFNTLGSEEGDTAGSLDLLLSATSEELGLDDHGLGGEHTTTEDLVEASAGGIDDGDLVLGTGLGVLGLGLLRDERPQLVNVDRGGEEVVLLVVVVAHTNLAEVARVTEKGG